MQHSWLMRLQHYDPFLLVHVPDHHLILWKAMWTQHLICMVTIQETAHLRISCDRLYRLTFLHIDIPQLDRFVLEPPSTYKQPVAVWRPSQRSYGSCMFCIYLYRHLVAQLPHIDYIFIPSWGKVLSCVVPFDITDFLLVSLPSACKWGLPCVYQGNSGIPWSSAKKVLIQKGQAADSPRMIAEIAYGAKLLKVNHMPTPFFVPNNNLLSTWRELQCCWEALVRCEDLLYWVWGGWFYAGPCVLEGIGLIPKRDSDDIQSWPVKNVFIEVVFNPRGIKDLKRRPWYLPWFTDLSEYRRLFHQCPNSEGRGVIGRVLLVVVELQEFRLLVWAGLWV